MPGSVLRRAGFHPAHRWGPVLLDLAFAPTSYRRLLTWIQGWATWIGYIATPASCINYNTTIVEGLVQLRNPEYQLVGWHTTLIVLGTLAFLTLVNMYAFRLVPWFEVLSGILNICLFLIFVVVLFAMPPRNSGSIVLETKVSSGWDSYFQAVNIGALSNIFIFVDKYTLASCSPACPLLRTA